MALVAGAALGRLSDRSGRRAAMLICASLATVGLLCLGAQRAVQLYSSTQVSAGAPGGVSMLAAVGLALAVLGSVLRRVDRNTSGGLLQALTSDLCGGDGEQCTAAIGPPHA